MSAIEEIDRLIFSDRYDPWWGWHDDHRHRDRTPRYRPALQQVRGEFAAFVGLVERHGLAAGGRFLQLGMGECNASHDAWRTVFGSVVTLDRRICLTDLKLPDPGGDVRDPRMLAYAAARGPYDVAFLDAGHLFDDVRLDHEQYGALVRPGGIVAFHDSLKRPGYEDEILVWRYLETLGGQINHIGEEVGIAWMIKS